MIDLQVASLIEDAEPFTEIVEGAATLALKARGVDSAELSITLMGDDAIRALNRDHLDHDWSTDVLSFALYGDDEPVLGDIYLGFEQAGRQAAEEGVPIAEEIARLAIHGTLHILGLEHPESADEAERAESEMYRVQEEILKEWAASKGGIARNVRAPAEPGIAVGGRDV